MSIMRFPAPLIFILLVFFCEEAKEEKKIEKYDYLSLSFALQKNAILEKSRTSIKNFNSYQNTVSSFQEKYSQALTLKKSKRYSESIEKFEEALNLFADGEIYYNFGNTYYSMEKYKEAIKAYEIAESLKYEKLNNLYYNISCAYSLLNDRVNSVKYLRLSIQKGFKNFKHISNDKDLDYLHSQSDWKHLLENVSGNKNKAKNIHEFLKNSKEKKLSIKSLSQKFIYGGDIEFAEETYMELFNGIVFYKRENTDEKGNTVTQYTEGSYSINDNSVKIKLLSGKKYNEIPGSKDKTLFMETDPVTIEMIYKEHVNGFMTADFVILGDEKQFVLDKKLCAFIKDDEKILDCTNCKKHFEQKGFYCSY